MALRDTIEAAVNTVAEIQQEPAPEPVEKSTPVADPPKAEPEAGGDPSQQGRTAGRPRDEHGRLLPGKAIKPEPPVIAPKPQAAPEPQQAAPEKPKATPPSSWKKDHWGDFEKLSQENPKLAEYLIQREGEFAKGVSTYKQEFERVKPLADAIEPLLPVLRQYNIEPSQWITTMGNAHHSLVFGTPAQKLQMFVKMANDYQVPLQALYDPQAQQQFLMQQTLQPPPQPQAQQPDISELVESKFVEVSARQELQQFESAKDASGNPLHPHFEKVRDDMALFLESGKATDLNDAYGKAIRLHDDIWQAELAAKQAATQKAAQEAQARQVAKAKASASSPRTATPSGEAGATKPTGIRSAVEAAVAAASGGGRV